jgi:hypothetical protein
MSNSPRLWAHIVSLGLAAAATARILSHHNPRVLVGAAAAVALLVPERDEPAWPGFLAAVAGRMGESLFYAAVAWSFASESSALLRTPELAALVSYDADISGAVAAVTLLSVAVIAPYVRVRARSLAIAPQRGASFERGVRLGLVTVGLSGGRDLFVATLWVASAITASVAIADAARIWRGARGA